MTRIPQRHDVILWLLTSAAVSMAFLPAGSQQESDYQNLRVLPSDIERDKLGEVMLNNLLGLGLPRRDGQGCLYCHVGDLKMTRDTWDYASDAKVEKRKARTMMAMVASINDHLAALEAPIDAGSRVGCATCHAGRTDPRPLPDVLMSTYEESGIETTIERYERLWDRYFGGDAYDFRPLVLARLAEHIAASDAFADAIALVGANLEVYPEDATANQTVLVLRLYEAYVGGTVEAALALADELATGDKSAWFAYQTLDSLGWTVFHERGDEVGAVAIFRSNLERFPDEYIPHESLADGLIFTGEPKAGGALYESWLERYPDHEIARRRLRSFRSQ